MESFQLLVRSLSSNESELDNCDRHNLDRGVRWINNFGIYDVAVNMSECRYVC